MTKYLLAFLIVSGVTGVASAQQELVGEWSGSGVREYYSLDRQERDYEDCVASLKVTQDGNVMNVKSLSLKCDTNPGYTLRSLQKVYFTIDNGMLEYKDVGIGWIFRGRAEFSIPHPRNKNKILAVKMKAANNNMLISYSVTTLNESNEKFLIEQGDIILKK